MNASEIRAEARQKLTGKWGKAAIITLVFSIITFVISFVLQLIPGIGAIIDFVITVPLSFGLIITMFKLNDDKEFTFLGFFNDGFSNFGKAWSVALWTFAKLIIPVILVVVTICILMYGTITENSLLTALGFILYIVALIYAIIKQFSYALALLVLNDNPDMTGKEAVEKSAELMQGKVWSLFCLKFSFLGWAILSIFTLGIGVIWLAPYIQISEINFYRNLVENSTSAE